MKIELTGKDLYEMVKRDSINSTQSLTEQQTKLSVPHKLIWMTKDGYTITIEKTDEKTNEP